MAAVSAWSLAWLGGLLYFLIVEGSAIFLNERSDYLHVKPRDHRTLSENLRWAFASDKAGARARFRGARRSVGIVTLVGGGAWLAIHLLGGGRFV